MRKKLILGVIVIIATLAVRLFSQVTTGSATLVVGPTQSLLAGKTPSNFTVPAGWTLAATQDFESGSVGSCQYLVGGSTNNGFITSTFAHTGTGSATVQYGHDADIVSWGYGCLGSSKEFYLSYWDYGQGLLVNEEYVIAHQIKRGLGGSPGFEEFGETLTYGRTANYDNIQYNEPSPQMIAGPQGNYVRISDFSGGTSAGIATSYGTTGWNQWEVWLRANTPNTADGFFRVYRNGVLFMDVENKALFGPVDMTGMNVEAGGWYTKNVWTNNGVYPPSGTCSSAPGTGAEAGSWIGSFSTVGTADCPPAPPVINRYIDDIILLKK